MDPVKYNYLLSLWEEISMDVSVSMTNYEGPDDEKEAQERRQQWLIDELKKSFGCT